MSIFTLTLDQAKDLRVSAKTLLMLGSEIQGCISRVQKFVDEAPPSEEGAAPRGLPLQNLRVSLNELLTNGETLEGDTLMVTIFDRCIVSLAIISSDVENYLKSVKANMNTSTAVDAMVAIITEGLQPIGVTVDDGIYSRVVFLIDGDTKSINEERLRGITCGLDKVPGLPQDIRDGILSSVQEKLASKLYTKEDILGMTFHPEALMGIEFGIRYACDSCKLPRDKAPLNLRLSLTTFYGDHTSFTSQDELVFTIREGSLKNVILHSVSSSDSFHPDVTVAGLQEIAEIMASQLAEILSRWGFNTDSYSVYIIPHPAFNSRQGVSELFTTEYMLDLVTGITAGEGDQEEEKQQLREMMGAAGDTMMPAFVDYLRVRMEETNGQVSSSLSEEPDTRVLH